MDAPMLLRLLTPAGSPPPIGCDSVNLVLADDARGRGGGAIGILRGHAPAVLALGEGPVRAAREGKEVFSARIPGGFATVEKDVVTVVCDQAEIKTE